MVSNENNNNNNGVVNKMLCCAKYSNIQQLLTCRESDLNDFGCWLLVACWLMLAAHPRCSRFQTCGGYACKGSTENQFCRYIFHNLFFFPTLSNCSNATYKKFDILKKIKVNFFFCFFTKAFFRHVPELLPING